MRHSIIFLITIYLLAAIAAHAQAAEGDSVKTSAQAAESGSAATSQAAEGDKQNTPWLAMKTDDAERVLLDADHLPSQFLMVVTLEQAIGSNDIGLDRAQNGEPMMVQFKRQANRVLLVQQNLRFVASASDSDEANAAHDAFASAVLWSGQTEESKNGRDAYLDIASLLTNDWVGVSERLSLLEQGEYALDKDRSMVLAQDAKSFERNAEFVALLTFVGRAKGDFVRQAAANPNIITIKQRISFIALPEAGFVARDYHPASGGYSISRFDFSRPIDRSLEVRLQPRFRLQKTNPNAARSEVLNPIVFYLDRGTPEPIRSALLEGANWWQSAFDKAGFINAFRAELAPVGMSMSDVRYNTITWTHRATRGWSYGMGLVDPRTGEIIKGAVNLGSQRVRQDLLIAEGLLAPYLNQPSSEQADNAKLAQAKTMALHRLKQLAAHEVGHALGFAHNFAASRNADGSVMDYPHPNIEIAADGSVSLAQPYGVGVGQWDDYLVANIYGDFGSDQQNVASARAKLRAEIAAKGYQYVSDADARQPGDAHESGALWDVRGDVFAGLDKLLAARKIALSRFAAGALPPDRQAGEAERRLVPIYLLHRYQTEAIARLLGGSEYQYSLMGEQRLGATTVAAEQQQKALNALKQLLSLEVLRLPDSVLAILTPPGNEYSRDVEYFSSQTLPMFDPQAASATATTLVTQFALAPERLNRLYWQHAQNAAVPSVSLVFERLIADPWQQTSTGEAQAWLHARNWALLDHALLLLDGGALHASVATEWRAGLEAFVGKNRNATDANQRAAAAWVQRYLNDPNQVKLRPLIRIPPGAPI